MFEKYNEVIRANNFKLALNQLKYAVRHLEDAGEKELSKELRRFGGKVVGRAFKVLPRDVFNKMREE